MNTLKQHRQKITAINKKLINSTLILLAVLFISSAQAAINWTPMNGPGGGEISSFEFISNSEIWASSQEGFVYKSSDSGASWSTVSALQSASSTNNTLTLRTDSNGKYYARIGNELFASTDSGTTWSLVTSGIDALYLDANDVLYKSSGSAISSSTDGGNTWTGFGVLGGFGNSVYVITQDGAGNFYALRSRSDVYRTTDGGTTWSAIADLSNLPTSLASDELGNLYAFSQDGLFVSSDNGVSWVKKTSVTEKRIDQFSMSGNGTVYAARNYAVGGSATYWYSTDNGATWSSSILSQSDTLIRRLGVAPNGDLYINAYPRLNGLVFDMPNLGGGRVIKLPTSGGSSYIDLNSGLGHVSISRIVESGSNLVATASYGNLWLSNDAGASWSVPATAPAVGVYGLGVYNGNVFAMSSSGVYRSADNGAAWAVVNASETGHYSEFASDGNGRLYIYGAEGLKYSDNNGTSWTTYSFNLLDCKGRTTPGENGLAVSADGQNLYANECYSNDAGLSWAKSSFPGTSTKVIRSLVLDSTGNVLAAKNLGGIEKSSDGGANYTSSNGGMNTFGNTPGGLSTLFRDSGNTFYTLAPYGVGAYLSGVWSSTDGGANWVRDNGGLPVVLRWGEYGALTMTETMAGNLILSTAGSGLFTNAGGGGSTDTTNPVVTAPANITVTAASASGTPASNATIAAFLAAATATDNVAVVGSVTNNATTTFPAGTTTTVTFSAVDAAGNTGTATATVTVSAFSSGTDTTNPVVTAPANITVAADSASGTPASNATIAAFLAAATATDNVGVVGSISNDAPTTFAAGTTTTVTFSASDAAGNIGTATATVTVGTFSSGGTGGGSTASSGGGGGGALGLPGLLALMFAALGLGARARRKAG